MLPLEGIINLSEDYFVAREVYEVKGGALSGLFSIRRVAYD